MCTIYPPLFEAALPRGFCAYEMPVEIDQARSVLSLTPTAFLALERGSNSVIRFNDQNGDGSFTRTKLVTEPRMTHGLAYHDGYLYASSDERVYRWAMEDPVTGAPGSSELVINNINADGNGGAPFGHTTRTLAFDDQSRLYVSVGSNENVDADSFRSRIRRFSDLDNVTAFPIDFLTGEVFADGLRNEVGLAFDRHGILWGVENGADQLKREDLGGDIHNDNPAEELNQFKEEDAGKHWGYPYCWTEFCLDPELSAGRGEAWAWPSFLDEYTDEMCRTNFTKSPAVMQAHTAPLGITFYHYTAPGDRPAQCDPNVAFPIEMDGYAFIGMHGSWNRDDPVGYRVVYIAMDADGNVVDGESRDVLAHDGPETVWEDGTRPVDVDFDACGRLLVSSDGSRVDFSQNIFSGSKIIRIEYDSTQTFVDGPVYPPPSQGCAGPSRERRGWVRFLLVVALVIAQVSGLLLILSII